MAKILSSFVSAAESKPKHVETLQALFAQESSSVALGPAEVTLVDRKVVRSLAFCEAKSVELRSSPEYLSAGVSRERAEMDEVRNQGNSKRRVRRKRATA